MSAPKLPLERYKLWSDCGCSTSHCRSSEVAILESSYTALAAACESLIQLCDSGNPMKFLMEFGERVNAIKQALPLP